MRWAPFLRPALRFENERLERLWRSSQNSKRHAFDIGFFVFFSLPTFVTGLKALQVKTTLFPKAIYFALNILYITICTFILLRTAAYDRVRGLVLGGFKLLLAVIICNVVMIEEPSADTWFQFVRFELLLFHKGFFTFIMGVCLPQPFLEHCVVQSCLLLLFLVFNQSTCIAFHGRQPSNYGRYQQVVSGVDSLLVPSAYHIRRDCPLAFCGQTYCMHVQAFLHIIMGFVVPSAVLFAMESRSRSKFLQERLEANEDPSLGLQKPDRSRAWLAVYVTNLSIGMALVWHWLGWLYSQKLQSYSLQRN